ncbi:MAG: 50S ribosomal protein L31e [Candidatus Pacearchaeota archaeon]
MAKKTQEPKIILEREYIVPLRKGFLKVQDYRRGKKALRVLKEFVARHMKVYDRDLRNVKVDILLNNEIRSRGIRNPPAKIKIKAKKFDSGIVRVELAEMPEYVKFLKLKQERKTSEIEKKQKEKPAVEKTEEKKEQTQDAKEKEAASKEEGLNLAKKAAKEQKHVAIDKKVKVQRKALQK